MENKEDEVILISKSKVPKRIKQYECLWNCITLLIPNFLLWKFVD